MNRMLETRDMWLNRRMLRLLWTEYFSRDEMFKALNDKRA